LGIQHQPILPAHPQQNGAHERMHKTLKQDAIKRPRATLALQQRAFTRFRQEYNDERPHQFLNGRTPGALYRPSPRVYTGALPALEYPAHFLVKRVTNAGTSDPDHPTRRRSHRHLPLDSERRFASAGLTISVPTGGIGLHDVAAG
jgi:hypothetical protein